MATEQSGRLSSSDVLTMKTVLTAIKIEDGKPLPNDQFTILVNKIDPLVWELAQEDPSNIEKFEYILRHESKSMPITTKHIEYIPKLDNLTSKKNQQFEGESLHRLQQIVINAPGIKVTSCEEIRLEDYESQIETMNSAMSDLAKKFDEQNEELMAQIEEQKKERKEDAELKQQRKK
jgi:hypothetical protein